MARLLLFNKPFKVLSQFTDADGRDTLAKYINDKGLYPAGRLDRDSEGLLLLTDDGKLQARISEPKQMFAKSYWVQVEGAINDDALAKLRSGVVLKDGKTKAAKAEYIKEPTLWPRNPPVRFRANIPTRWIKLTITEGKNRQVRRMTAAVGFPTLRLVRHSIGDWQLNDLQPGESQIKHYHLAAKPKGRKS